MSKLKIAFIPLVGVLIFLLGVFFFLNNKPKNDLSADQKEIIQNFGKPSRFTIQYLPFGTERKLIRVEKWFYPERKTAFSFSGGRLVANYEIDVEKGGQYKKTVLNPADFDYNSTPKDIERVIGERLEKTDAVDLSDAGMYGRKIEIYNCSKAVFGFDTGHLTYMESVK